MIEKSHADLERHHYQAVHTNGYYRMHGMIDVLTEEALLGWPLAVTEQPEPEKWDFDQWQTVQQLRAEIQYVWKQLAQKQETKKRLADPF